MEPYHINVNERGAFANISKNKKRKLQRYYRSSKSDVRLRKILKAEIPFFWGAFGNTSYIWRKLEENALVIRKGRGDAKMTG